MKEKVLHVFQESSVPMKAGEVAEKAGLEKKEVDKAIKMLKNEGLIDSPRRCYYSAKR